jgi:beta-phosphoglucomutase-like phosphatase (HAD superfamily)
MVCRSLCLNGLDWSLLMDGVTKKMTEVNAPERALFFELEFLAVSGWSFLYDAVKSVLSGYKIKMTLPLFSQYFAGKSPAFALRRMAADYENDALAESDVLDAVKTAYVETMKSKGKVSEGLVKLISDLRGHGISLGALTCLDQETVSVILEQLKLSPDDIYVMESEHCGRAAPTAQDWLKLAKDMQASTTLCTVAATSASSCKAALCAGMRCFAVPDRLTAFHDFSGADYVIESLDDGAEELVMKLIEAF